MTGSEPCERRIVLGISGGIAAYKTAELVRRLVKQGIDVVPIMTHGATQFIGPLTLEALSGHRVRIETSTSESSDIDHISLIRSAKLLVIAPLTANTLAKLANGFADNFLTATYLAHRGETLLCPAMNTAMLEHPATQRNLGLVESDGAYLCYGKDGTLACGDVGAGRMAEPEDIADYIGELLAPKIPLLKGRRVLVTAGPTREDLDPVRYITNRSSGKMGFAIAKAFRDAGADVTLVFGPTEVIPPARVRQFPVRSASEMAEKVLAHGKETDIAIMAAAVADYRPMKSEQKLKKHQFDGKIAMEPTLDILNALGKEKPPILVGFAAESENVLVNAGDKLARKNLDFIFANDISTDVFGSDGNHLICIDRQGQSRDLGRAPKETLARLIVEIIAEKVT